MRFRLVLMLSALAGLLVVALPSAAVPANGEYECRDSRLLGIDTGANLGDGPSCSFVVTCPIDANGCTLSANGFASGIGDVGVGVLIGQTGPETQCGGPLSCGTATISRFMGPGDEATVVAIWFSQGTTIGVLARVGARATRQDA
jgi:hypothetical protein